MTVISSDEAASGLQKHLEGRVWLSNIQNSPEARARPAAAAAFLASCTPDTHTTAQAIAFIRGLPVETEHTEERTMTTDIDPRAARCAEIQGSMKAFNASRGYTTKPTQGAVDSAKVQRLAEIRYAAMMQNGKAHTTEARTLKLALDTHATTGAPMDRTLASLGFDVSKLFVTR